MPIGCTCKGICIQSFLVSAYFFQQTVFALRIQDQFIVQAVDHLHDILSAVNLHIFCNHLVKYRINKFHFYFSVLFLQCTYRYTILARTAFLPEIVALTGGFWLLGRIISIMDLS